MTRLLSLSLVTVLFLAVAGRSGNLRARMPASQGIPKAATVKIILLKAPGLNDEGSQWEIAYEFRITNEATLWKSRKDLRAESEKRVGELIKEDAIKKSLRPPENRVIVFKIPFSSKIQEELRNQPKDNVKIPSGEMTPEAIQLLKDREMRSQVFLFYPVINIYDAKLKKNFIIPYRQTWDFVSYRQARFEIKVEINNDGSYSVNTTLPSNTRVSN